MVARSADRAEEGVFGREAAREREAVGSDLDRREALLQRGARGVAAAGVLVARSQAPDAVLGVGGHLVDRWHHGTRERVWILARVDGEALESQGGVVCCVVVGHAPSLGRPIAGG